MRMETVPYDDMPFVMDHGEELHIVYSIKSIRSRFRTCVMGPQGVSLYESDIPHFGPIYVYRCERKEVMDADGGMCR